MFHRQSIEWGGDEAETVDGDWGAAVEGWELWMLTSTSASYKLILQAFVCFIQLLSFQTLAQTMLYAQQPPLWGINVTAKCWCFSRSHGVPSANHWILRQVELRTETADSQGWQSAYPSYWKVHTERKGMAHPLCFQTSSQSEVKMLWKYWSWSHSGVRILTNCKTKSFQKYSMIYTPTS